MDELLRNIEAIAKKAGDAIMRVYESDDFSVELKDDNSPLTQADKQASQIIETELRTLSEYPVVSEENQTRIVGTTPFWLVDPLDGTKEFIKRNDEFTVNIALVSPEGEPIIGVVYAPALDVMYSGDVRSARATKQTDQTQTVIHARAGSAVPVIVTSRSHKDEHTQALLDTLETYEEISMGSSLKLCLVAEGKADLYPRFAPTSLWDTAAADAIVRAAGGAVQTQAGQALVYQPGKQILNPYFIVSSENCRVDWQKVLDGER